MSQALSCQEKYGPSGFKRRRKKKRFLGASVAGQPLPAGPGVALPFFVNWWRVYVNILINRENRSPIYVIWGAPTSHLEGVREKMCWKAIYFAGVGG